MAKASLSNAPHPAPSLKLLPKLKVSVVRSAPSTATAIGVPVGTRGAFPREVGFDREALAGAGFEGKLGQTFVIPHGKGAIVVAVGIGDGKLTVAQLRDAAAAFARAASRHPELTTTLADAATGIGPKDAAEAVVEGILLARYRYEILKSDSTDIRLKELTLVTSADRGKAQSAGAQLGKTMAGAAMLARDLANAPAKVLTAAKMADVAVEVAHDRGLQVEVFDKSDLAKMGCGGMLGVNAGSTEPPRMVKLTYKPKGNKGKGGAHLAMVGKGIMYDSGGINLKPAQGMQLYMKMDMAGAAAVLGAMSVLRAARPTVSAATRLVERRYAQSRRCAARLHHGCALPAGVGRWPAVVTLRHLRNDEVRHRRFLALARGHGCRRTTVRRPGGQFHAAEVAPHDARREGGHADRSPAVPAGPGAADPLIQWSGRRSATRPG